LTNRKLEKHHLPHVTLVWTREDGKDGVLEESESVYAPLRPVSRANTAIFSKATVFSGEKDSTDDMGVCETAAQ